MSKAADHIELVYFLGIGGIGMSAIARYYLQKGKKVAGYDKTPTTLTQQLTEEGASIHYSDSKELAASEIEKFSKEKVQVVFTPAIPKNSEIYQYLKEAGFELKKRAEILGLITRNTYTAAVAGTHGKTTTSSMLTHLLVDAGYYCTAFLGGISVNYANNFISESDGRDEILYDRNHPTVVEADEFDRSFLHLSPDIAAVTSVDADHLDIYGSGNALIESFQKFTSCIKEGGVLISKKGLNYQPAVNSKVRVYSYAIREEADFYASGIEIVNGKYQFTMISREGKIEGIRVGLPGLHNVENAVAAASMAQLMGVSPEKIKKGLETFRGVKRRFEYIYQKGEKCFIDDYAHHPRELEASILSIRELFPGKKVTGIFQPHLFSRTRDFAEGFAQSLALLDELILMEIYPARELPIPGIDSDYLLGLIDMENKVKLGTDEILEVVEKRNPEILVTLGAGDIDQLVDPIKRKLEKIWS